MRAALLLLAVVAVANAYDLAEIARKVNSMKTTWKADVNAVAGKHKYGALPETSQLPRRIFGANVKASLPTNFFVGDKWANCPTMKEIRDQGTCGSCWAISSAEVMSDRECVFNNRTVRISTEDINSCSTCGSCDGGYPSCAFKKWVSKGYVSEDCAKYSIPGCDHHIANSTNPCNGDSDTPACPTTCKTTPSMNFAADKHKASKAYSVSGEDDLMADLYESGSIGVAISVYADFEAYTSGIYHHVTGEYLGGHAVKLVGWGVENGVKYWLVANSWNPHWGEKGFFRFLRGTNECGIESSGNTGNPVRI